MDKTRATLADASDAQIAVALADRFSHLPFRNSEAAMMHALAFSMDATNRSSLEQMIMLLDLQPGRETEAQHARSIWWQQFGAPLRRYAPHRDVSERPLRIGYVSGDFKLHSCALIWGSMLLSHSPRFEPIAYSSTPKSMWDIHTRTFQQHADFRDVAGLSDDLLAETIYEDRVDILVDLSGFTPYNRLRVFAMTPSPIQISAWGYSIGLGWPPGIIDAIVTDAVVCPPSLRANMGELILDLPCQVGQCVPYVPPLSPLPCLTQPPTFGAFHQARKINSAVLALWDAVLQRVPDATLVFKGAGYTEAVQQWILQSMRAADRVRFCETTSHVAHLAAYQQIDVVLDTFPQTGCVTCMEALMMGVPSVTLMGPTMLQRAAASILTTAGLTEWVTETAEAYIETAVRMVHGKSELAELRKTLRDRVTSSPLYVGYTDAFESQLLALWRRLMIEDRAP